MEPQQKSSCLARFAGVIQQCWHCHRIADERTQGVERESRFSVRSGASGRPPGALEATDNTWPARSVDYIKANLETTRFRFARLDE
jgi:hypothetical protein